MFGFFKGNDKKGDGRNHFWMKFLFMVIGGVVLFYLTNFLFSALPAIWRLALSILAVAIGCIILFKLWEGASHPVGRAVFFFMLTVYFFLVNVEGYWQLPGVGGPDKPSFMYKPFISDGANIDRLFSGTTWGDRAFLAAIFFSLVVNGWQALSWRQAELDSLEKTKNKIEGAGRAEKIEEKKTIGFAFAFVVLSYLIDGGQAFSNFPWFGEGQNIWVNIPWCILSIFAAEACYTMFLRDFEAARKEWEKRKSGGGSSSSGGSAPQPQSQPQPARQMPPHQGQPAR